MSTLSKKWTGCDIKPQSIFNSRRMKRRCPAENQTDDTTFELVDRVHVNKTKLFAEKELKRWKNQQEIRCDDTDDESNDMIEVKTNDDQENRENQFTYSLSDKIRMSNNNNDFSQNILATKNKNVPIEQFRPVKSMLESNRHIDFEQVATGPSYVKGQFSNSNILHTKNIQSYSSKRAKLCQEDKDVN